MGQVALGFRSLLIKLAIFFVMAALLAWALGGTLWPRAEVVDYGAVSFDGREWFWRLTVGGREPGPARSMLMVRRAGEGAAPVDGRTWVEIADPVGTDEALYYAGRASFNPNERWRIERIERAGERAGERAAERTGESASFPMPDRLAVERQLARIKAGLSLQDHETIEHQRGAVLDPPAEGSADAN